MTYTRRVIRKYLVPKKLGISSASLALWLNPASKYYKPSLPGEITLGVNSKGFYEDELDAWLESHTLQSRKDNKSGGAK
jgi:predicted DNA-binding transcriptional regulator AlpA